MPWTDWQSGWVYTNVGSGQDWTNPTNADANQNLARATLPNAATWTTSKFLWPVSGVIDWNALVPSGAPVTDIEVEVFFAGSGIIAPPYRNVTAWLCTVGGLQSNSIGITTNQIGGGGGWRTYGSSLAEWGMNASQLNNWMGGGAVAINCANGGDDGNIGIDAVRIRACYMPIAGVGQSIVGSHGPRITVGVGL